MNRTASTPAQLFARHQSFTVESDGRTHCFCHEPMDLATWLFVHLPSVLATPATAIEGA